MSLAVATLGELLPRDQRLTSREREVLLLIAEGGTARAILLGKTRAKNSVQLVLEAQALGWLDLLSTPHAEG
jgi:DNA-binding CsgD family transcriptional regulator